MIKNFVDCNCMIGRRTAPLWYEPKNTAAIKKALLNTGIIKALVYHSLSVEYHPIEGNKKLLLEIRNDDFFIPSYVVMPNATGEFLSTNELRKSIVENNIKALRLAPSNDGLNYSISELSMKDTYLLAEEMNIPVIIDINETNWDAIENILSNHPTMNLIVARGMYRVGRYLYPLMKEYKNLYFDISMYKNNMGLEHLCKTFGSKRLLYGSAMPRYSPGCAKAMIINADIDIEDKKNIASRNILRLMGEL